MDKQPGKKLPGYCLEELAIGMAADCEKTITDADIALFADITGDTNPVHLDKAFASKTPFKEPIAHGFLTASLLSTVIGTQLPGPGTIYLSQTLQFKAAVKPGDTVQAKITVMEIDPKKKQVRLKTECLVGDKAVITGEAMVMAPVKRHPSGS